MSIIVEDVAMLEGYGKIGDRRDVAQLVRALESNDVRSAKSLSTFGSVKRLKTWWSTACRVM